MRAIVTVLDSLNQTTMPYNEFILYREKYYKQERQIVFLTGNEVLIPEDEIPKSLEIHKVGKNPVVIHRELVSLVSRLEIQNEVYVIHLHSIRGTFSTLIAMIGTKCRFHTVYTVHSTFTGYRLHNKVMSLFDAFVSHYVTCVSNTSYKAFPRFVRNQKKNNMCVVENGVNLERIDDVIQRVGNKDEKIYIDCVYVARMVPLKNHKFLIDVLCNLESNIRFIFVGEESDDVRKYAEQLGVVDKIVFTGLIPREKVYDVLYKSDIYVSSSTLEGLPVSVLEAMYCGLPVVLSDIPQHREVASNVEGALLVDFDVKRWAEAIIYLCNMSESKRKALGNICRNHAKKEFSLRNMHRKYDFIYSEILSRV